MYPQLKLDNQLCFRLYTAARLITASYTPFFKKFGITYPQYLVLMLLWEKDNQVVGDITEKARYMARHLPGAGRLRGGVSL